jgi:DNA-directed RNA polymerase subunit RPC12/RpoP
MATVGLIDPKTKDTLDPGPGYAAESSLFEGSLTLHNCVAASVHEQSHLEAPFVSQTTANIGQQSSGQDLSSKPAHEAVPMIAPAFLMDDMRLGAAMKAERAHSAIIDIEADVSDGSSPIEPAHQHAARGNNGQFSSHGAVIEDTALHQPHPAPHSSLLCKNPNDHFFPSLRHAFAEHEPAATTTDSGISSDPSPSTSSQPHAPAAAADHIPVHSNFSLASFAPHHHHHHHHHHHPHDSVDHQDQHHVDHQDQHHVDHDAHGFHRHPDDQRHGRFASDSRDSHALQVPGLHQHATAYLDATHTAAGSDHPHAHMHTHFGDGQHAGASQSALSQHDSLEQNLHEERWSDLSHAFAPATLPIEMPELFDEPDNLPPPELKCTFEGCTRAFRTRHALAVHFRTHTGEKPFLCEECGKSFSDSSTLRQHRVVHSGERLYRCRFCDKTFGRSSIARAHERITHGRAAAVQCKECGREFASSSSLNRHMQTHTGQRPHTCRTCGKSFGRLHHLERHMKTMGHEQPAADSNEPASQSASPPESQAEPDTPPKLPLVLTLPPLQPSVLVPRAPARTPAPKRPQGRMPALAQHRPAAAAQSEGKSPSQSPPQSSHAATTLPPGSSSAPRTTLAAPFAPPSAVLSQPLGIMFRFVDAFASGVGPATGVYGDGSSSLLQLHSSSVTDSLPGPDSLTFSLPPFPGHGIFHHEPTVSFAPDMALVDHHAVFVTSGQSMLAVPTLSFGDASHGQSLREAPPRLDLSVLMHLGDCSGAQP